MYSVNVGIDCLLELNLRHAQDFTDLAMERRRYRCAHPTEIAAILCMDGRLHLPVMTQTAIGIIQPFRVMGGHIDLGWPFFQLTFDNWVQYSIGRGKHCLVFLTYHFSRGDVHRGCKGFGYDTDAARAETIQLKDQFDRVYGKHAIVPIVCGIETDLDALILHGEDGRVIDLAEVKESAQPELEGMLRSLYPSMPTQVVADMLPLIEGNIRHIAEIRTSNRSIEESEHKEWVLAIGTGFDWLHTINTAFMVRAFDPNVPVVIETAARLLKNNIDAGRVDPNGIVLLTAGAYRDAAGAERKLAKEKALFFRKFALDIIKDKVPDLIPYLQILTGTTDLNTRRFEVLERLDTRIGSVALTSS